MEEPLGVSISLLFVRGRTAEETLRDLELSTTEERRERPIVQRGILLMANPPSGFDMIWSNTCDERRFSRATLAKLSEGGEAIVGRIEEHVMFSQAELWRDGKREWEAKHFGDFGSTHLETEGSLPAYFDAFRKEQDARGPDPDYFEVPVCMVEHVTGYRYDRLYSWENGAAFTVLASTAPIKKPFWKFW
jgi:hypothetical protein